MKLDWAGPTKEDIVECLEAVKGDPALLSPLKLLRHNLDHLLLLLLRDARRVEKVPAEVGLRDELARVLRIPGKLHFQHVRDQITLQSGAMLI